jgi:transcriptional regulator with XRE-family HTH domain
MIFANTLTRFYVLLAGMKAPTCSSDVTEERPNEALGHFLRLRRESIAPGDVGLASRRGRRTRGLRREEVAFLADIGVKWYARLEAGHEIHPSETTLKSIVAALGLSPTESEYLFQLAGLHGRAERAEAELTISESLSALLGNFGGAIAAIFDRANTPLQWNELEEAAFGHSAYGGPVDRNLLVRALYDDRSIAMLGDERIETIAKAVGILRFNLASARPSPYAPEVYERVKSHALFRQAWDSRVVAADLTSKPIRIRNHPREGRIVMHAIQMTTTSHPDLLIRVYVAADESTTTKFERIDAMRPLAARWQ